MAGWVYGAGSSGGGTPGGEDKDIQFNNNGRFSGSTNLLITDGSGSLSASTTISASSFHGDGSNLTGLTASAVNVADGPEFSLQFRRDDPITGEISGSGNLTFTTNTLLALTGTLEVVGNVSASTSLSASGFFGEELETTSDAVIKGQVKVGPGTGVGYVASNGDPNTRIRFGAAGLGSDSMSIEAGGKAFIVLDENGRDELTLGTGVADVVHVSGSLTASVGLRVSASAADGQDIFVGAGNDRTIGVLQDSGDDFFLMGHDAGAITLSASSGVEFVANTTAGVSAFGCPIHVYDDTAGSNKVVELSKAGDISGSGNISGSNFFVDNVIEHIGDSDTKIIFGTDDLNLTVAGKTAIDITYDGSGGGDTREITFNEAHEDIDVRIEGDTDTHLFFADAGNDRVGIGIASPQTKLHVSSSTANGNDIFVGSGTNRSIGVLQDSGADFFVIGHDDGNITLSSSSGVEVVTDPTAGLGLFAAPIKIYNDQNGDDTRLFLSTAGVVSASSTIHGTNFIRKQSPSIHASHFSASNAASLYLVNVSSAPVTASLPGLTAAAQIGETYTFKDYFGSGSVNTLHISPSGSQEIDEGSQLRIEQAFGAATVTAVSSSTKGFSWVVTSTT